VKKMSGKQSVIFFLHLAHMSHIRQNHPTCLHIVFPHIVSVETIFFFEFGHWRKFKKLPQISIFYSIMMDTIRGNTVFQQKWALIKLFQPHFPG
jgi:hypothetical protein